MWAYLLGYYYVPAKGEDLQVAELPDALASLTAKRYNRHRFN